MVSTKLKMMTVPLCLISEEVFELNFFLRLDTNWKLELGEDNAWLFTVQCTAYTVQLYRCNVGVMQGYIFLFPFFFLLCMIAHG